MGFFDNNREIWLELNLKARRCRILHFNEEEVKLYLDTVESLKSGSATNTVRDMEIIKSKTHYNPYLVCLYATQESNDFTSLSLHYMRSHLESLFQSAMTYRHLRLHNETFIDDLYQWSVKADNNMVCYNIDDFTKSFPYEVGLFYYQKVNTQWSLQ